ncbi:ABC transporter ATP-binding protein [Xylanibacillus composti]|uniref:Phage protein n=1 Tax=Xylanibacillus composti TaxID=1572762 RepID=A0A8J4H8Q1_9BACL|nr:ABC transporter ATP-binding protein [Xylanibacillus composti]MDT9723771.1 ABC transporter ATP-binding protein [Xylanibacillus composti]GIQ70758.1 phage protein [Xylanibacillus composti]
MINYRRHRRQIERMYEDRATISRQKPDESSVETKLISVTIYENEPCKLSQTSLARNGQTEAQNDIRYDAKLFIAPELEIKQGDEIAVTRAATGRVETYTAGEPFPPYSSHQEINLKAEGWA